VVATLPPDTATADELAALRVLPGEEIEVVQVIALGGPVLIRGAGGLYAIGRGLADLVVVEP
jgi:Fe2+ transport system protein FeoA